MHADNGQAALDILKRSPKRVNLVLLDIIMPIMNGMELLKAVKVRATDDRSTVR